MSGRWVPPAIRIVEDPAAPRCLLALTDRGDRRGHRPEMHGDVLGLRHHLAAGVEERARGVAALLDVGRVRGAHEQRPHLLARGVQRSHHERQLDPVRAAHERTTLDRAVACDTRAPARREEQRRLGQREDRGPLRRLPGGRLARDHDRVQLRAVVPERLPGAAGARSRRRRGEQGRRSPHRGRHGDELDRRALVAVAVCALVRGREAFGELLLAGVGAGVDRELEGLPPIAQCVTHARRHRLAAQRRARPFEQRARPGRLEGPGRIASRGRGGEPEGGEDAAGARAQDPRDPERGAISVACSGPAPPNGSSA